MPSPNPASPMLEVRHRLPGRVRFRARGIGGAAAARLIRHRLNDDPAIASVDVDSRTGSILVCHAGDFDAIAARVADYLTQYRHRGPADDDSLGAMTADRTVADEGPRPQADSRFPWSESPAALALARLASSATVGLTAQEAKRRLKRYGSNVVEERPEPGPLKYVGRQVATAPIATLGVAALVSAATGGIADAVGIGVAIAVNSLIGATTEWQSEKTIRLLSQPATDRCQVRRDGRVTTVSLAQVVPGDILVLTPGEIVPADARLIVTDRLIVDESALTGESVPIRKHADALCQSDAPLAEQSNMVFRGTAITGGSGTAVVVATGVATEMGRIQLTAESAEAPETPMARQLRELGGQLTWLSVGACVVVFGVGWLRGGRPLDMMKVGVALGVAAVPEGLPAVATTTLAIGLRNMRRKGLLVRNINAVETVGAVDVVCLDKTGTLTKNRIAPVCAFAGMRSYAVRDGRLTSENAAVHAEEWPELKSLLELIALSNDSTVVEAQGTHTFLGTATENALLELALLGGVDVEVLRDRYPRLETRYRSEAEPYMTTLHRSGTRGRLLVVKGSPREVLKLCERVRLGGRRSVLDDQTRAAILAENERWSSDESLRVLGVAYDQFGHEEPQRSDGLTWLGLVGLQDPLRHGMRQMIADLHDAGITTVMITGDQMGTAAAIGRQLALGGDEPLKVLDSRDLSKLDPELLEALVQQTQVFARVSPANKLEIVQSLQRAGKVVAMTGDGINDGPALKAADVGIAMGNAQNEVARSVADIVVADDRLESVIAALAQGRAINANIRKSIHYLVSTNLSEIEVMLASTSLGMGLPLTPMQLLWLNLATDALPAIALALEPPDADVLRQPPRDRAEPIITKQQLREMMRESAVITAGAMAVLMLGQSRYQDLDRPRTMAFNSLITAQLLHAFACRNERSMFRDRDVLTGNRTLSGAIAASVALQGVALFAPPLRRFLGSGRLGMLDIAISMAGALVPLYVNDYIKTGSAIDAPAGVGSDSEQ